MNLQQLIPESRKLRVMILTLIGYLLNVYVGWLSQDQIYDLLMIVGGWLGVQGYADAGAQGAAIAEKRKAKNQAQLDPIQFVTRLKDKDISPDDREFLTGQLNTLLDLHTASTVQGESEISESSHKEEPEEPTVEVDETSEEPLPDE